MKEKSEAHQDFSSAINFRNMLRELISPSDLEACCEYEKKKPGRPSSVSSSELVSGLVFHSLQSAGTLSSNIAASVGVSMSDSSISERRQKLPWEVFEKVMSEALRVCAVEQKHENCFYRELRLIALDGTNFSLRNTPQILRSCSKTVSRRLEAAFAKVCTCVLLEVGLHNPIAAQIATEQESEWELSQRIIKDIPPGSIILADKLYGCGAFIAPLYDHCQSIGSEFLIRARSQIKTTVSRKFKDGSCLVTLPIRHASIQHRIERNVELREIRARIHRPGFKAIEMRLWTSLLSPTEAPASELIALYSERWEHELYYRELKHELADGALLASNTPETAAQEIAALIIASALVARTRQAAAARKRNLTVTSVSFRKALTVVEQLWLLFSVSDDILTEIQQREITERLLARISPEKIPKTRSRSYPREVRQPVKGWPRKTKNRHQKSDIKVNII